VHGDPFHRSFAQQTKRRKAICMSLEKAELGKECSGRRALQKLVTTGMISKSSWENNGLSIRHTDRTDHHQALMCELPGSKLMPDMMHLMIIFVGSRADAWGPSKEKQRYVDPMWEQRSGGYAR